MEGSRLSRSDLSPELIWHLSEHLSALCGPVLSPGEQERALERLREMTFWNIKTVAGEEFAQQALQNYSAAQQMEPTPSYGDGHLAPWEWIRTEQGDFVKTDDSGHSCDHTLIGKQSVLWDVAGAIVEWSFSEPDQQLLLEMLAQKGLTIDRSALGFYRNAYAAFQIGKASLCSDMTSDSKEGKRLRGAVDLYKAAVI